MEYSHTQYAPMHWLLYGIAIVLVGFAVVINQQTPATWILLGTAGLLILFALGLRYLRVSDEGQWLAIRYGPLPLLSKRIPYDQITSVERGRSSWIDGWGIHYVFRRGWTYNLWGFDCAVLRLGAKIIRIGTDDPDGLVEFLKYKLAADA